MRAMSNGKLLLCLYVLGGESFNLILIRLGASAFFTVFKRKQSCYHGFLDWLEVVIAKHPPNPLCVRVATAENSILASRTY